MLDQLLDPHVTDTRIPAIGYIRVSLAREEMISPELQRTAIEEWAKRTGHRIVEWIADLDKTGRNFKRRIMQAIERVEQGEARVIAVWKYSRFGRNRAGIEHNLARIEKAHGQLVSATEDVDATTATGWFQRDVIFSVATFESKRAGEQWKETHQWRRDNGLPAMGKPRFGYSWTPRKRYLEDGTVVLQDERYEPDPERGPVLQSLYERFINGESFRSLALWLNDEGFKTAQDRHWSAKAVIRVLDSGFAAGYLRLHDPACPIPECVGNCTNYVLSRHPEKHHPAVIDDETWQKYLTLRAERRALPPRARKAAYPYTGLYRCSRCGSSSKRTGAAKSVAYVCTLNSEKGKVACLGTRVAEAELRASLMRFLKTMAPAIDTAALAQRVVPQTRRAKDDQELLREKVAKLERAISKHMRVYALLDEDDPNGTAEREFKAVLHDLRSEKASLEAQLVKYVADTSEDPEAKRKAAVPVAIGLLEEWDTLPPDRLNFLLRKVLEKGVVRPDRRIDYHPAWLGGEVWTDVLPEPVTKAKQVGGLAARMIATDHQVTARQIAKEAAAQGLAVSEGYVRVVVRELRQRSV